MIYQDVGTGIMWNKNHSPKSWSGNGNPRCSDDIDSTSEEYINWVRRKKSKKNKHKREEENYATT